MKIDVAGLKIDAITKKDLLTQIIDRIRSKQKTFVVTPYSEFLYASLRRPEVRTLLNSADFSIADGVGVLWAHSFLSVPPTLKSFYGKVIQAWWQMVWTGASILLRPSSLYKVIPEKIVGADLVWDLARIAQENNFKVYLLGARGDISERAAKKLQQKYPGLQIVGTSNKQHFDPTIIDDINASGADIVLVAFQGITQEQWIADNLNKVSASFAIGLGGTFDYLAGVKLLPPNFVRAAGLEWLYRLITQPSRAGRIYRGFWGLILSLVRLKVFSSMPFRSNAVAVVVNQEGKVLLCKRAYHKNVNNHFGQKFVNYWQFPQGGLDDAEEIKTGARRELLEETGIKSVEVIALAKYTHEYLWNSAGSPLLNRKFRYKGQSQQTVFFNFIGDDSEIQLDQHELVGYQWVHPSEVEHIIAPERREHAAAVLAELSKIQV